MFEHSITKELNNLPNVSQLVCGHDSNSDNWSFKVMLSHNIDITTTKFNFVHVGFQGFDSHVNRNSQ